VRASLFRQLATHIAQASVKTQHSLLRLVLVGTTFVLLPLVWVLFSPLKPFEAMALTLFCGSAVSILLLARGCNLWVAQAYTSACFCGAIILLCWGGHASKASAFLLLALIPLEAILSGSWRGSIATLTFAGCTGFFIYFAITPLAQGTEFQGVNTLVPWIVFAYMALLALVFVPKQRRQSSVVHEQAILDETLLAAVEDLITWHDSTGRVVRLSHKASTLLGVPANTLLGHGLLQQVHILDRPKVLHTLNQCANKGEPQTLECRIRRAQESASDFIWLEMRVMPLLKVVENGLVRLVVVSRNITERKQQVAMLEVARLEAEKANALKGRFLTTVSHELRTPLNAILGFSEVLRDTSLPQEQAQSYAAIVHQSGTHLLEVVTALLDMSKIESGTLQAIYEPFNLSLLVRECCDALQLRARDNGITLDVDIPSTLRFLEADRRACKQIVLNVLSNALKFTPQGGNVHVSVYDAGTEVALTVRDTGIGIPAADLDSLGQPFFQSGSAYSRTHEGTGLGLSIVRGLVGMHKGRMDIESAPHIGTQVMIFLPFKAPKKSSETSVAGELIPITTRVRTRSFQMQAQTSSGRAPFHSSEHYSDARGIVPNTENLKEEGYSREGKRVYAQR
jgi:two-component system, cell cycle sensor histidine kinase DivJ